MFILLLCMTTTICSTLTTSSAMLTSTASRSKLQRSLLTHYQKSHAFPPNAKIFSWPGHLQRTPVRTLTSEDSQSNDDINQKLYTAKMNIASMRAKAMAWKASRILLIPPTVVPTVAATGMFGAASIVALMYMPIFILDGDAESILLSTCAYAGFLGSYGLLRAEDKLDDYMISKYEHYYAKIAAERQIITTLQKKHRLKPNS